MSWNPYDKDGNAMVKCEECGRYYHRLDVHLARKHGINVKEYQQKYPGAETISEYAKQRASEAQKGGVRAINQVMKTKAKDIATSKQESSSKTGTGFRFGCAELFPINRDELDDKLDVPHIPEFDEDWVTGEQEKEQWEYLALGISANENVFWTGPTGCGKTAGTEQVAAVLGQPCQRLNMDGEIRKSEFVGKMKVVIDKDTGNSITKWVDGVLTNCMRRGHWLILDELDAAPQTILLVLQRVLESGKKLTLAENDGEVVEAHPRFRIIATANTKGSGDESGMYTGTGVLNQAFLDRFAVTIEANYPQEKYETRILVDKTGLDSDTSRKMVSVANKVRKALKNEECSCTFSTRRLLAWASMALRMGATKNATSTDFSKAVQRSAKITVLSRLETEDKEFVAGLIQRHFGGEV